MEKTILEESKEALKEAKIISQGNDSETTNDRLLEIAESLSGIPVKWLRDVQAKAA